MSHCNSVHPPKSNYGKVPALENIFDQGIYLLCNGPQIHSIFLRVHFNDNISDVDSAHSQKSKYEKVPALENTFDQ